jgi:HPt (histidine-containing phosphotransfer) domain-containing protein
LSDLDEKFELLRQRFLARCRQDLEAIRAERDPARLRLVVHRLSGAAGTFGYPDLSALAGEVDDVLVEGGRPTPEIIAQLVSEIERTVGGP